MPRHSSRPSRSRILFRFHKTPSLGVVALLLLLPFASGPLAAQMQLEPGAGAMPRLHAPSVSGLVTAVEGNVVTILGSQLLKLDLTEAIVGPLDAEAMDTTAPPIAPGAFIMAFVEASGSVIAIYPPPPLKVIRAGVRPAGTAVLTGEIQGVGPDSFTLLFRAILVDAGTVFRGAGPKGPVKGLSDLEPGMQAEVWVRTTGDTLTATRVVAHGPTVVPQTIRFRGVVKSISPESWTIGEFQVGITASTKIVGDPKVGDTADVEAQFVNPPDPMMGMPSRLVAISIVKVVLPPPPVPGVTTTFTGLVEAMPPSGTIGLWKIAQRLVTVTGLTKILGNPQVGSTVSVTGYALPNPMAGAAITMPTAIKFIATEIKTLP